MNKSLALRALDACDAEDMATIHERSFETSWSALDMSVHTGRDLCFGVGSPVKSFVIFRSTGADADMLTIATHPDYRRQALGQQLLQKAHERLKERGVETIFLEVAEDNLAAQALYRNLGYQAIGRRPAYYRRKNGRVAAITFSLSLAG